MTHTAAQQLGNGENVRLLQLFYCDGAGNFHWDKVAQAELHAGVAGNPNRGIERRTFDALDGWMQLNHR
jgi:hypothetical protein